jgi:hypothetical protein
VHVESQGFFRVFGQCAATHGLAGFGGTNFHDMPGRRRGAKVMIVADDAVDIGARHVQFAGELANRLIADPAKAIHERMQYLHEHFRPVSKALNQLARACRVVVFASHSIMRSAPA